MSGTYRLVRVFSGGRRETLCTGIKSKETADRLALAIGKAGKLDVIAELDERVLPCEMRLPRKRAFIAPQLQKDGV